MRAKKEIALLIMIGIFVLITVISVYQWMTPASNWVEARDGMFDAGEWDFRENGYLPLRGEWEYYDNELLTPEDFKARDGNYIEGRSIKSVPTDLKKSIASANPKKEGAATFRLLINVPERGEYGLRAKKVRIASHFFVNGVDMGGSGRPALSAEGFLPSNEPYYQTFQLEKGITEIIVHTANYDLLGGGLVQAPEFGLAAELSKRIDSARLADVAIVAMLITFGLYYAGMFRQWSKERYLIHFCLFCLSTGLFVSLDNEIVALTLFPQLPFPYLQRLLFLLPFLCFYLFAAYIHTYMDESKDFLFRKLQFGMPLFLAVLIFLPNAFLPSIFPVVLMMQLFIFTLILRGIFRGRQKGIHGSQHLLLGYFFLVVWWAFGQLRYLYALDNPYFMIITPLLLLLSQAMLISDRLQDNFLRSEQLSEKLLQYDRQKDEFLAKTSHELRTPLHGIVNLSQSLLDNREQPLQEKHRENIRLLHLMGRRLSGLVNDILDMNRIRHGQFVIHPSLVNVGTSLHFVMETLSIAPVNREVRLINELPSELPLVYADENRLKQILHNLIENGLKFTKRGTVSVSAECRDGELAISVTDTGPGIPAAELDYILQPFGQYGEGERDAASEGLGLGLSISKQLIEMQGGLLEVVSDVGRGSRFTFTLPLAAQSEIAATKAEAEGEDALAEHRERISGMLQSAPGGPFHILIVDDELSNMKVLMDVVSAMGYSYEAVGSGEEALDVLLGGPTPDLVLLDLMLTGISGLEVCRRIRLMQGMAELPVLMLTASGRTGDMVASFEAGANDILQKPFELAELKARMQSLLKMKDSSEQAVRKEMDFLQAQITPHFLYNSLNSLVGLSYSDTAKLRETIYHLTTYLRSKFTFVFHSELIAFDRELELVQAYVAIESLRFGERLQIRYNLDDNIECLIPPLTLQPIVENAVRHGIGPKPEGGTLVITARRHEGAIRIVVEDDGVGMNMQQLDTLEQGRASGIGYRNVNRRLQMLYNLKLEINSVQGKGTRVMLLVPEVNDAESNADRR
ncbi:ATP-binding protein [Paenibacillus sp. CAU 1782]